jgi:hypothetical protein
MLLKTPVWFHELTLKRYFFCNPGFKTNHESHDGIIYIIQIVTKDGNAEQQTKVNLTRIFRDYSLDYFISTQTGSPTMNYWICSMKLLEVKLKRIKKLHMLPLKLTAYRFLRRIWRMQYSKWSAVGSGKSSVFRSHFICHGDTKRLNKTDKRSYVGI